MNPITKERLVLAPKPMLDWSSWGEGAQDEEEPADDLASSEGRPSFPAGAIRRRLAPTGWHPGWLPLATLVDVDFLGVDLAPDPRGVVGQVIAYGRYTEVNCVLAASWAQFLDDVADELEAGNFVIDMRRTGGEFKMQEPGDLSVNCRAWSEAKLEPRFLRGLIRSSAGG